MSTEYGLCECGCGQRTTISPESDASHGYVKGEPRRYRLGHANRGKSFPDRRYYAPSEAELERLQELRREIARDMWLDRHGTIDRHGDLVYKGWDEARIIKALRAASKNGYAPRHADWRKSVGVGSGLNILGPRPSMSPIYRVFGSWGAAVEAAGLTVRPPKKPKRIATTHCRNGHLRAEFGYINQKGRTRCRRCDRDHWQRWHEKQKLLNPPDPRVSTRVQLICPVCGIEFVRVPSGARSRQPCCSFSCASRRRHRVPDLKPVDWGAIRAAVAAVNARAAGA